MTDLLTLDEAAQWLGISRDTFDTLRKEGKIAVYKLSANIIRVHKDDLVRYVESCRVEIPAQPEGKRKKPQRAAPRICGYVKGMDVV